MTAIREIVTDWTTAAGGGMKTVMYFESGIAVALQRSALQTFWTTVKGFQATSTLYTIETAGREIDDATGALTGSWAEATAKVGAGSAGAVPFPDEVQGLVQWRTASIVNGRFLRGRTFLPGMGFQQTDSGNLLPATRVSLQTAANALIASAAGLVVWHRPIAGSGGSHDAVSTATIWQELAVLRRRRR